MKDGKFPKGEYGWGGAASTHFWISPKHDLIVIALSQYMPYSARLENTVKPIVYDSILNSKSQSQRPAGDISNEGKSTDVMRTRFLEIMGAKGLNAVLPEEIKRYKSTILLL